MFGLLLNTLKCEAFSTEGHLNIHSETGKAVKPISEPKYLGFMLNDSATVQRQINKRISEVFETYKKLDPYWNNWLYTMQGKTASIRSNN